MATTTTLALAKAATDLQITLTSAVGVTTKMLAVVGGERMRITRVDRAPVISVVPGYDGTTATAHDRLAAVSFGLPSEFAHVVYRNAPLVSVSRTAVENDIPTAGGGSGIPAIRATGHFVAQTAAIPAICTYTPTVDTTLNVMVSLVVTVSNAENFTATVAYTDTGGTPRVATLPWRLLTGVNVLIVNFANGAVPYAGVCQQFRVLAGTTVTLATTGAFGGAIYSCSAEVFDSQP